jgi:7-carboxy-7-deazaguanine synthase
VCELFASIQGETSRAGLPTVFVRFAGCNLDCTWCDTPFAREEPGEELAPEEIVARVQGHGLPRACLTGGEPLLQPGLPELVRLLLDAGLEVSVETNGTLPVTELDPRAAVVLDVKLAQALPGVAAADRFLLSNLARLTPRDALKFVVACEADLEEALAFLEHHKPQERGVEVLFSAVEGRFPAARLARALVERRLGYARLNIQVHKVVYGAGERGV